MTDILAIPPVTGIDYLGPGTHAAVPLRPSRKQARQELCWLCLAPVGRGGQVDHYDGWLPPIGNRCAKCRRAKAEQYDMKCGICGTADRRKTYHFTARGAGWPKERTWPIARTGERVWRGYVCNRCFTRQERWLQQGCEE